MPLDPTLNRTISITEFRRQCFSLTDAVARGRLRRIILTKYGRPVAEILPASEVPVRLWGAMRGRVRVAPDTDLTRPTEIVRDAEIQSL